MKIKIIKKFINVYNLIILSFIFFTSAYATGHLSSKDKKNTLECAGLYFANSMIPQGTLKLDKIVHSIAAKKFLKSYLIKEGLKEDLINSELNKSVDKFYGKPYDEKKTIQCDKFIYKLIPESKKEIDKLVKSGIY
tara:strand:+ start:1156 stop:1563 length:408 start_codon:yes stop_codon:yes gene_type:complete